MILHAFGAYLEARYLASACRSAPGTAEFAELGALRPADRDPNFHRRRLPIPNGIERNQRNRYRPLTRGTS